MTLLKQPTLVYPNQPEAPFRLGRINNNSSNTFVYSSLHVCFSCAPNNRQTTHTHVSIYAPIHRTIALCWTSSLKAHISAYYPSFKIPGCNSAKFNAAQPRCNPNLCSTPSEPRPFTIYPNIITWALLMNIACRYRILIFECDVYYISFGAIVTGLVCEARQEPSAFLAPTSMADPGA